MHPFLSPLCLACLMAGTVLPSSAQEAAGGSATVSATSAAATTAAPKADSPTAPKEPATVSTAAKPVDKPEPKPKSPAAVSTILPEEIDGFETYPPALQSIITEALGLTKMNLRYQFGSADPGSGGMDCSGTIYYLLRKAGIKDIPRQSDEVCHWVMLHSLLYRTENVETLKDRAFSALKPGDLLFWTGTYETASPREIPVTHVMMYLGKRKKNGLPVIFGASEGRTYEGQRRNGVSVFDFPLPRPGQKSDFYGYGPLPSIAWEQVRKTEPAPGPGAGGETGGNGKKAGG